MNAGKLLSEAGLISEGQKKDAEKYAKAKKISIPEAVIALEFASKDDIYRSMADTMGIPYIEIAHYTIEPETLKLISQDTAHRYRAIPIFHLQETLTIACETKLFQIQQGFVGVEQT